jgi:hypothetical protein
MLRRDNGLVRWHPAGAPVVSGGCCCESDEPDAPSSCPCDPWPPESWPCGGLLEEYSLDAYVFVIRYYAPNEDCTGTQVGYYEMQLESPITLTAGEATPCYWDGLGAYKERYSEGGSWTTGLNGSWSVSLAEEGWNLVGPNAADVGAVKVVGITPAGSYPEKVVCIPGSSESQTSEAQGSIS